MRKYRTALGKIVDMAALAAKNEKVRAVGNMRVNARGDSIDSEGKVIVPVTQKVGEQYSKTVQTSGAQVKKRQPVPSNTPKPNKQPLTKEEQLLEDSLEDDLEIEKIKARENSKRK